MHYKDVCTASSIVYREASQEGLERVLGRSFAVKQKEME